MSLGGQKRAPSRALPLDINYRFYLEELSIMDLAQRDLPCKLILLYNSSRRKEDFLSCPATGPMRNHHHPELSLSCDGFSFKTTPPNFFLFLYEIPLLCVLDLPIVFAIAG